jgi:hypothetical protein
MMTFEVTPQLALEIKKEIANCQIIIAKEMQISEDLRYYHVIESNQKHIQKLRQALTNGFL